MISQRLSLLVILFLAAARVVAAGTATLEGIIVDPAGIPAEAVRVSLLTAQGAPVVSVLSRHDGRFEVTDLAPGSYELVALLQPFPPVRRALQVTAGQNQKLNLRLTLDPLSAEVTVTADPGRAGLAGLSPQPVNVISEQAIAERANTVVAQAVEGEAGVQLQRTSGSIAGVFIRGLTGRNVNVFVDGVAYSTSAQRGGISTFLDMIEPETLGGIEVLRGPQGARYGSAALGGSLQLLSRRPAFAADGDSWSGKLGVAASSSDIGVVGSQEITWAGERSAVQVSLAERQVGELVAGGDGDPLAAVTRFLGLPSEVADGSRLGDTGFVHYGGQARFDRELGSGNHLTLQYRRAQQENGQRYDQKLGGDGNLVARLDDLMLDFGLARFETSRFPGLDSLSVTASVNVQREVRVNQGGNGNPSGRITSQFDRTSVGGLQIRAGRDIGPRQEMEIGADFYDEHLAASAWSESPVTGTTRIERPRVPDGARYQSWGVYAQTSAEPIEGKLWLNAALRASGADYRAQAADSPLVGGEPLWPDDAASFPNFTGRAGLVAEVASGVRLAAAVSRGYRAPNVTDLGTLGLTGAGFEVAEADVRGLGAEVGSTAGADAVSLGVAVAPIEAETSLSYEARTELRSGPVEFIVGGFVNDLSNVLEKQALILPAGAVGSELGGEPIVRQLDSGVVFVDAASNPVLVRANFSRVRMKGIEQTLAVDLGRGFRLDQSFTWVHAADRSSGLPPNLEGGTPGPGGMVQVGYRRGSGESGSWSLGAVVNGSWRQDRLSSLDLEDRRIGAYRSRSSIRSFFSNGATARGLVGSGPDGILGNDDDLLLATGETLEQVQNRVLGVGVTGAPLRTEVPGWVTFDVRASLRVGRHGQLFVDLINLTDRSFRGMSWGVPGPGRGVRVRWSATL